MNFELNRLLAEQKMEEMRKYANDTNLYEKKKKKRKLDFMKKQRSVQVLRSKKIG